jgi:hypothetical protein
MENTESNKNANELNNTNPIINAFTNRLTNINTTQPKKTLTQELKHLFNDIYSHIITNTELQTKIKDCEILIYIILAKSDHSLLSLTQDESFEIDCILFTIIDIIVSSTPMEWSPSI